MNGRLWYPQLDVFDCVRRLAALVDAYAKAPGVERLCITDFYLANPPLLHLSTMKQNTRRRFYGLQVPRPQRAFITYPAPALLFAKMESVQREALRAMAGKGLLSMAELQRGVADFTEFGRDAFAARLAAAVSNRERELVRFLAEEFAAESEPGSQGLRRRTGLRRAV